MGSAVPIVWDLQDVEELVQIGLWQEENIANAVELLAEYGPGFHGLDRGV